MRKKYFLLLCCCVLTICPVGCENRAENKSDDRTAKQQNTVEDIIKSEIAKADIPDETTEDKKIVSDNASDKADNNISDSLQEIDVDLTEMSSTIVYSEVYNMMYEPNEYIGKTIKMNGIFKTYHDDSTGNNYFACIIQDATACCTQGIEFVPTDEYSYPNDYPSEDDEITVIGVFDTYIENGYTFYTLRNAEMM
ncbi:MAG: hypothetical protein IJ736_13570 [Firmicutes bacterium]|nr:hypothetical protein [Bacillota bacterium]